MSSSGREARIYEAMIQVIQRAKRAGDQLLADAPVDASRFYILTLLLEHGPQPQRSIAEAMGTTPGNVSQLLRSLEADGLVERPARKRTRQVHLTPRGEAVVERLRPEHGRFIASIFRCLNTDELDTLEQLVPTLLRSIPD